MVEAAKQTQYVVDGAIEAELLDISNRSEWASENHADIPIWGEMSGGAMKNIWFEKEGDFAEIKLTEQFVASKLQVCAAVGPHGGKMEIYVNGKHRASQDLYSNHGGVTNPYIHLGENEPVDNAFIIKFVYKGVNHKARTIQGKAALGIDFFLVEESAQEL
jgi:hypothetical protein